MSDNGTTQAEDHKFSLTMNELKAYMSRYRGMIQNALTQRTRRIERFFDERRDIDVECGFPKTGELSIEYYKNLYEREPVAARVVEILPKECWKISPVVKEQGDHDTPTKFEQSWDGLNRRLQIINSQTPQSWFSTENDDSHAIWNILERADIVSGIGHYGGVFIGLSDVDGEGRTLSLPIDPGIGNDLLFIKVLDEDLLTIGSIETDDLSTRFGRPNRYTVAFGNMDTLNSRVRAVQSVTSRDVHDVHWTRIVHIAESVGTDENIAVPRQRPVYNNLYNLRKLYSGDAEMYWMAAFMGLSFETEPDVEFDVDAIKKQVDAYMNKLQRFLLNPGIKVNQLAPSVASPQEHVDIQIDAICIKGAYPKRIFLGSERGELASIQDRVNWHERIHGRRVEYVTPKIIVPVIDRLIWAGVLEAPTNGYVVTWPKSEVLTELEKAQLALTVVDALVKYIQGQGQELIQPDDLFIELLGMPEERVMEMLERTAEFQQQVNDGQQQQPNQQSPASDEQPEPLPV